MEIKEKVSEVEELEDQEVYEVETQEAAPLKKVDDTRALTPEIMNLVGSTDSFIKTPFIMEGAFFFSPTF